MYGTFGGSQLSRFPGRLKTEYKCFCKVGEMGLLYSESAASIGERRGSTDELGSPGTLPSRRLGLYSRMAASWRSIPLLHFLARRFSPVLFIKTFGPRTKATFANCQWRLSMWLSQGHLLPIGVWAVVSVFPVLPEQDINTMLALLSCPKGVIY